MRSLPALTLFLVLSATLAHAEEPVLFSVTLDPGNVARQDAMVAITHGIPNVPATASGAVFSRKGSEDSLQADLDPRDRKMLWVKVPGPWPAEQPITLDCRGWVQDTASPPEGPAANFLVKNAQDHLMLAYHAKPDPAPEGASPLFIRSAFIHPLASPAGSPLTDSRPSDHLHHMGVWHAWTTTKFQDKKVDFWNLKEGQGTVRFREYQWRHRGRAWTGFAATQDHVAWPSKPVETKVLEENLVIRTWPAGDIFIIDYDYTQKNVSTDPLELSTYRYGGGVGFRGRADWNNETSDYLTSEGKSRKDAHQTRARWVAASGPTESGPAGLAMLGHPANIDAPQRLRTWGSEHNGAIFINMVPTQEKSATLPPGQSLSFRYRLVTFQGKPDAGRLDAVWNDYATPVKATVVK